jgi:hypothetical protein
MTMFDDLALRSNQLLHMSQMKARLVPLFGTVFIGCLIGPVYAQNMNTGSYTLPGCKAFTQRDVMPNATQFTQGICIGVIDTLLSLGANLPEPARFCPPPEATVGEAVRVAVIYLEEHPDKLGLNFKTLSTVAFRNMWPCR